MKINRRMLMLPALAIGLLGVVPAFAGADEDAVAKGVEAFRVAQAAGNAEGIAPLCAEELSYSHSSGAVDDKAKLLAGVKNANYKWTSLEYKNPTVRIVGPAAIVRFNFVGEQEFTDGKKTPQNLAHPDELAKAGQRLEAAVPLGDQALTIRVIPDGPRRTRDPGCDSHANAYAARETSHRREAGRPVRPRARCGIAGLPAD